MSFEDTLKSQTPTQQELQYQKVQERKDILVGYAKCAVEEFSKACKSYAQRGYHSCWSYANSNYESTSATYKNTNHKLWSRTVYYIRLTNEPDYRTGYSMDLNYREIFSHEKDEFIWLLKQELKAKNFDNAIVAPETQFFNLGGLLGRKKGFIFFKMSTSW